MLNRRFIIGAIAVVLAFFGILTFALTNNPTNEPTEEPSIEEQEQQEQTPGDETEDEDGEEPDENEGEGEEEQGGNQPGEVGNTDELEEDTTAPIISGVTDGGYYNQDVIITVTDANLDKVVVNGVEITLDANNQYTFSAEDSYVVVASDESNNSTTVSFVIDKTLPEITGIADGEYSKQDVTLTISDTNIDKIIVNGEEVSLNENDEYAFNEEKEYVIAVTDKAGNTNTLTFVIDKTAPVLTVNGEAAKDFYNSKLLGKRLEIKATDINLKSLTGTAQYFPPSSTIVPLSPSEPKNGEVIFYVNFDRIYTFEAEDKAGNKIEISFVNDIIDPVISGLIEGKYYYNEDVTLTIADEYIDEITVNDEKIELSDNNQYTFSEEKEYNIVVTDKGGNTKTVAFEIDKTAPVLTVNGEAAKDFYKSNSLLVKATDVNLKSLTGEAKYFPPSTAIVSLNQNINNKNGESFITVSNDRVYTFEAEDQAGNKTTISFTNDRTAPVISGLTEGKYYYKEDVVLTITDPNIKNITDNGVNIALSTDNKYTFNTEGEHKIVVKDKSGNENSVKFVIDKTAPVFTTITHLAHYNNDVTIMVDDDNLDSISVYNQDTDSIFTIQSGDKLTADATYNIIAKDKAGNQTEVWIAKDSTKPEISGVVDGGIYNTDVEVTVYDKYLTYVTLNEISMSISEPKGLHNKHQYSGFEVTEEGTHTIIAKDKVGNTETVTFTIDKQPPVIISVSGNPTNWTNETITLTVTAEDNFGSNLLYQFNGGAWTKNNTYEVASNQTVTIKVKDETGNESLPETVEVNKIDKSAPTVVATRAHGDAIVFQDDYESSITVKYSDVGNSRIMVAKYAKGIKDKAYFTSNGTLISDNGTINNVKKGEVYTIYVKDRAGNDTLITVNSNIYGSNETVDLGNIQIKVSKKYVEWFVNYRDLTVTTSNGVTLTHYGKVARKTGYRDLDYMVDEDIENINTTNLFKKIKRDNNSYHTVYLKDSTGKEYLIWIEITGLI